MPSGLPRADLSGRSNRAIPEQLTVDLILDDPFAQDLVHTTFVVLDLETTGGSPHDGDGITEVGAVKVRGGEELGRFATLVNPGHPIPPFITVLTGITTAMVTPAPKIEAVLPGLLEFLRESVVVAHNAPYDVGFLKAACTRHGYTWPNPRVLDTAALARRVLIRDEVPNRKLGTLAAYLRTEHQPNHRAFDDALATVDVLHALIGRLGSFEVRTLGDAIEFTKAVTPTQRAKRGLADGLPHAPGVYIFRAADDRPLYVGTSGDIATRVRTYFTAAEKRARMSEMIHIAQRVDAVVCAHALEAQVRELRLIAAHAPPYNRRSKFPDRAWWVRLTDEPFPRLSVVREPGGGGASLGPFAGRQAAQAAVDACHEALPLRQCTTKLSARKPSATCALAELGRCPAPCELRIDPDDYGKVAADPFATSVAGDPSPVVDRLMTRLKVLADAQRFEEAAALRGRLAAFLRAVIRMQRLSAVTRIGELVGARRDAKGGWEIAIVRHGRLAGAITAPVGTHPRISLETARLTAETVRPAAEGPIPCATAEETERILDWLERPETRLVEVSADWASPIGGAARLKPLLARLDAASMTRIVNESP
ncbi:DEDD exonuclease domain-containing protein [Hamadaea sp.]|uniref:DEDD exonuclease domain-containing protein n=1 Tax=Hamadaea sp. TaxID=2024425 RepID=UPI0025BC943E|nr:DEDD exonuclease domain-containing protein [Hamadaea sp.]